MSDGAPLDARHRELLDRWQEDEDPDALDELLRVEVGAVAARLRARGGGMISPSISASDLAQEAVMRYLRLEERPSFADERGLRAYLWTAAWRLLLNRVQRPGRDVVRIDAGESLALSRAFGTTGGLASVEGDDQRTALDVIVNLMKPDDREILSLVYFRGASVEEAAKELGLPRGTVEMRLSRARRRLAEKLVGWADVVG